MRPFLPESRGDLPLKHKFFIACVGVALGIALFSGVFAIMGWGSLLPQVGSTILYPFQWVCRKVGDGVSGFGAYFADMDDLQDEAEALRAENESLKAALVDAEIAWDENRWLYRYLAMKEEHDDYQACAATVTASSTVMGVGGDFITQVTLNKGSTSGVAAGMPVVTERGLVGVVVEVGPYHCRVNTVLDPATTVGAVSTRGGVYGLCTGNYSYVQEGKMTLVQMSDTADIQEGDIILTGGQGSVYPYGIPLGRVESVSHNSLSRTTEAVVTPFADLECVSGVIILTAYERGLGPSGESGEDGS